VRLLLNAEAAVGAADADGCTPLHLAAQRGHNNVVQLLLDAQADISAADNEGEPPLCHAARDGHKETVQLLLAAPQLASCLTEAIASAARAAAAAGPWRAELAFDLLKALIARALPAAAEELADRQSVENALLSLFEVAEEESFTRSFRGQHSCLVLPPPTSSCGNVQPASQRQQWMLHCRQPYQC
jgi:ankyrin repeat protein